MNYYNWLQIVPNLSNEELSNIIKNKISEPDEKVSAAMGELRKRGLAKDDGTIDISKKVLTKPDENSPILYSERVIYSFSIFFSVIFGGVLFAINLKEINKKGGIIPVIIFSILFTVLSVYILSIINLDTGGTLVFGALGALIINEVFWKKYIGKDTIYHKKSIIKPLIIALLIFIPLTIFVIWTYHLTGKI